METLNRSTPGSVALRGMPRWYWVASGNPSCVTSAKRSSGGATVSHEVRTIGTVRSYRDPVSLRKRTKPSRACGSGTDMRIKGRQRLSVRIWGIAGEARYSGPNRSSKEEG